MFDVIIHTFRTVTRSLSEAKDGEDGKAREKEAHAARVAHERGSQAALGQHSLAAASGRVVCSSCARRR